MPSPKFPVMLRRMWSGGDVQKWLDENVVLMPAGYHVDGPKGNFYAKDEDEAKAREHEVADDPDDITWTTLYFWGSSGLGLLDHDVRADFHETGAKK